jgi:hypothetical protein
VETQKPPKKDEAPKPEVPKKPRIQSEVERALNTCWFLRRRSWNLDVFLKYVEAFLRENNKTHHCGLLRFEVDQEVSDALVKTVVIALEKVPLLQGVEQVCRQLGLKYAVDTEKNTVRLTRTGKGKTPPPLPVPPPPRPREPEWRSPPRAQKALDAFNLKEWVKQAEAIFKDGMGFGSVEPVLRRIGAQRTREALYALRKLTKRTRGDTWNTEYIVKAMAVVDSAEAAMFIIELAERSALREMLPVIGTALEGLRTKSAAGYLGQAGLWHEEKVVRVASARMLGAVGWKGSLKHLKKAVRSPCSETRAESVKAISQSPTPEAIELLFDIAAGPDSPSAASALEALCRFPVDRENLLKVARSIVDRRRSEETVLLALYVLGQRVDEESLNRIVRLLRARSWQVKLAAIQALVDIRHEGAVKPLIDCLAREDGRVAAEVASALHHLTGFDFGLNAEIWKRWWANNKDRFFPPPILRPISRDNLTVARTFYHNIPVVSKRIAFVLDISGSMSAQITLAKPPEGAPNGGSRLEFCRWEMSRVIENLSPSVWFNIIIFESTVRPWEKNIVPALPRNKAKAWKFLNSLSPMGSTNLFDALKEAFQDPHVDTLYVLSDGAPNTNPDGILRWVCEKNKRRFLIIHTISVGYLSPFMKQLAEENKGRAVVLK